MMPHFPEIINRVPSYAVNNIRKKIGVDPGIS